MGSVGVPFPVVGNNVRKFDALSTAGSVALTIQDANSFEIYVFRKFHHVYSSTWLLHTWVLPSQSPRHIGNFAHNEGAPLFAPTARRHNRETLLPALVPSDRAYPKLCSRPQSRIGRRPTYQGPCWFVATRQLDASELTLPDAHTFRLVRIVVHHTCRSPRKLHRHPCQKFPWNTTQFQCPTWFPPWRRIVRETQFPRPQREAGHSHS